jgi:hypothetical protein
MIELELAVRYAADGSVEVAGSRQALKALAALLRLAESTTVSVAIPQRSPDPYQSWLDSIVVQLETEPQMIIAIRGNQLIFRGGQRALNVLADNVEHLAGSEDEDGAHTHIEYFPGHFYLREGSIPLVVSAIS